MALGDALGVPHEFIRMGKYEYTEKLVHRFKFLRRYQPQILLGVGQFSDDTEMTISLARSLIENNGYDKQKVVESYIKWAHSGQVMIGKNTRALFKVNIKTKKDPSGYQHYQTAFSKQFEFSPEIPWTSTYDSSQSNGALMRCFPLACLPEFVSEDVWSTNPSLVALNAEIIYVKAVRLALMGTHPRKIWDEIQGLIETEEVRQVFVDVSNSLPWTLTDEGKGETRVKKKGWVLCPLYASLMCLAALASTDEFNYRDLMKWIIGKHPGSDTDTNGAIAGALIGSILGYEKLVSDPVTAENVKLILDQKSMETELPRPAKYRLDDLDQIVEGLVSRLSN